MTSDFVHRKHSSSPSSSIQITAQNNDIVVSSTVDLLLSRKLEELEKKLERHNEKIMLLEIRSRSMEGSCLKGEPGLPGQKGDMGVPGLPGSPGVCDCPDGYGLWT